MRLEALYERRQRRTLTMAKAAEILARITHEPFCCNRRFTATTSLRRAPASEQPPRSDLLRAPQKGGAPSGAIPRSAAQLRQLAPSAGKSPVYVKEQLGHSSIQITVDCYGHLIPGGNKQAVDRLDTPLAQSAFHAESATPAQPSSDMEWLRKREALVDQAVIERRYGVSDGFRTRDLRIHNPAL